MKDLIDCRTTFSKEEITEILNRGKDMILNQLIKDDHITLELAQKFSKEYFLTYINPASASGVWGKLFNKSNEFRYVVTKIVDTPDWEEEIKERELLD